MIVNTVYFNKHFVFLNSCLAVPRSNHHQQAQQADSSGGRVEDGAGDWEDKAGDEDEAGDDPQRH